MNIFSEYFDAPDASEFEFGYLSNAGSLLATMDKNKVLPESIEIKNYDIALFGVPEDRNSFNKGSNKAPREIRRELYKLYKPFDHIKIVDLGNLKTGKNVKDTYAALSDVLVELLSGGVIPVIMGGTQDLSYAVFRAYEKLKKTINITSIDSRFDFENSDIQFNSRSWMSKIILSKSKYLLNYTNIGYQTYYNPQSEISLLNKMYFDVLRLGAVRSAIHETEPYFRDSDFVSIDLNAVKQCDAPGNFNPSVNGLYGEEICQMAKYSGTSENVSCFGLFELNPSFDLHSQTAELSAQIIWHFIQGFYQRINENPTGTTKKSFKKFFVKPESLDHEIVFFHSERSDRWWVQVPYLLKGKQKNMIISCSYSDYLSAAKNEIPERWLKFWQKLN